MPRVPEGGQRLVSKPGHGEHFKVPGVVGNRVGTKGGNEVVVRIDLDGPYRSCRWRLASCRVRVIEDKLETHQRSAQPERYEHTH